VPNMFERPSGSQNYAGFRQETTATSAQEVVQNPKQKRNLFAPLLHLGLRVRDMVTSVKDDKDEKVEESAPVAASASAEEPLSTEQGSTEESAPPVAQEAAQPEQRIEAEPVGRPAVATEVAPTPPERTPLFRRFTAGVSNLYNTLNQAVISATTINKPDAGRPGVLDPSMFTAVGPKLISIRDRADKRVDTLHGSLLSINRTASVHMLKATDMLEREVGQAKTVNVANELRALKNLIDISGNDDPTYLERVNEINRGPYATDLKQQMLRNLREEEWANMVRQDRLSVLQQQAVAIARKAGIPPEQLDYYSPYPAGRPSPMKPVDQPRRPLNS
jgi:hypothetical protein